MAAGLFADRLNLLSRLEVEQFNATLKMTERLMDQFALDWLRLT